MSAPKLNDGPFANRYRVIRELGRGGMGTVDIAYQIDMQRVVALKRILPGNVGLASAEAWFRREYRALAAIPHPGVPAIYDCGKCDDKISYFTMEIIEGPSLASALKRRAFEVVEALTIAIELARILAAVHTVGVIHRDVKPANIILEAGGRVRLIDFGICTFLPRFSGRHGLRSVGENEYKTGPMEVAGSPGYTDPALFSGHPPTVQSDIFSVCVILYEMIARRRLFDERAGGFQQIDTGEFAPELAQLVGELRRGSQLLPKDRHASMDELVRGLEIARSTLTRLRAETQVRSQRRWLLGLAGVNVIVLIALGRFFSSDATHAPALAPIPAASGLTATNAAEQVPAPVTASDLTATNAAEQAPAPVAPEPSEPVAVDLGAPLPAGEPQKVKARAFSSEHTKLSPASVSKAATAASSEIKKCLTEPGKLNLEIMVEAGRARISRVEWIAFNPKDKMQSCVARALRKVKFPRIGPPGPYRLAIG